MRFLNLILILLMWTEAVFAVSTTDNNKVVGKTLKVALEYVTSMSKIDGSFESGNTGWVASVGTITPTASTEFQGNYKGLWSATGTGTLDLQWTATASNTYEASAIVSVGAADSDHYVCAVVNGVETGCTLFDGPNYTPNKQIKVSVVADSVKGASFYLRIKHTGTDAFNLSIDDGKIQPWTPQVIGTATSSVVQAWQDGTEWTSYTPTFSAGFGTVSNAAGKWKRSGSDLEVFVSCTTGNVATSLATVSLPSGLSIDSSKLTINNTTSNAGTLIGTYNSSGAVTSLIGNIIAAPSTSTTLLYLGAAGSISSSHLTPSTGNQALVNSTVFSFYAKVPIQGWSSAPTLLALPNGVETDYYLEAAGNGGQILSSSDAIPFIATVQNNLNWNGTSFTAPTSGNYKIEGSINFNSINTGASIVAYVNNVETRRLGSALPTVWTIPFNGKVYLTAGQVLTLKPSSGGTLVNSSVNHWLSITRLNGKIDKTFVGTVQPDWQYDLTVTGTNWTTTRAVGVVYKCGGGQYRMKFNIDGTVSSGSRNLYNLTTGIRLKASSAISSYSDGNVTTALMSISGTITIAHASATTTNYQVSGDVELDGKPSWAVNTP